jgi:hypothetical protein
MTGRLKFEVDIDAASELLPLIGQESFELTFSGAALGDGFSIVDLDSRPDADGNTRHFLRLVVPETTAPALGLLFSRSLIGTKGKLVLSRNQATMSDQITTAKADDGATPDTMPPAGRHFTGSSTATEAEDDLLPA